MQMDKNYTLVTLFYGSFAEKLWIFPIVLEKFSTDADSLLRKYFVETKNALRVTTQGVFSFKGS